MASSKSISTKTDTRKAREQQQRAEPQRFNNVLLIWLDSSANDNTDGCRNKVAQLRRAVNNINTFTDGERCVKFIEQVKDVKICMVVSGSLWQYVVPCVHDLSQVDSIFIVCSKNNCHEQSVKYWPKIKGVFPEITSIQQALRQAAQQCEQNATPMSFMASDAVADRLEPSFMYTQILKEIILTIDFNDQHIHEYVDYCREAFSDNQEELKYIKQMERHYREKTPIWWYTCECFLYPMLNRALRTMNGDTTVRMGFFIKDLHRHIEQEYQIQYADRSSSATFTVYRGQGMAKADFEQLTKTKGGLISFNCFLSTSTRRTVSLGFAERATMNPDLVGVLFEMKIDPSQSTTPFASIGDLGAIEGEDEVLFGMHSVFRVREIKTMGKKSRFYEVHLSLTSDKDPQLRALTDRIREESFPGNEAWCRLALILNAMEQLEKAEEIYRAILERETSESTKLAVYGQLGTINYKRGGYKEAIEFYTKALTIQQQSLPPTHPQLAISYSNIGNVHDSIGAYPKALAYYEKALAIRQQALPSTHPDLATSYSNIGVVHISMGNYPKALASYEKALTIRKQALPPIHPDLALSYSNIGATYQSMGEDAKALASHEKALKIRQQSLPPTHPDLATSYNNIGNVYGSMGDDVKALASHEKALAIRQQALPPTHPHLAGSYSNIGVVYRSIGDAPKALVSYKKALAIYQQSLPPTHPDLATSYNNIGLVYKSMGNYSKALASYEKALAIQQKSLPPIHPDLAMSHSNIGTVQFSIGDYSKALPSYEKALTIRQQSLPPTHPDLAVSYGNIGLLHEVMKNYAEARAFFERALQIAQQSLPANHPDLQRHRDSFQRLKNKL